MYLFAPTLTFCIHFMQTSLAFLADFTCIPVHIFHADLTCISCTLFMQTSLASLCIHFMQTSLAFLAHSSCRLHLHFLCIHLQTHLHLHMRTRIMQTSLALLAHTMQTSLAARALLISLTMHSDSYPTEVL